jgi:HEAT repeat protein
VATKSRKIRRDPFKLNEPYPRIAGGARRPAVVLRGDVFARIRDRARLERRLLLHDPDGSAPTPRTRDMSLLRQIATEGAVTNHVPTIRRGAILLLGESPTPENLAILTELAVCGEDFHTRSHALVALGRTGLTLAAPVLRDALRSEHREEQLAAEAGLRLLGSRVGPAIVIALRGSERDTAVRDALGRVIAALIGKRRTVLRRHTSARDAERPGRR